MTGFNNKKIGFIIDSSSNIKDGEYDDVKVIPLGVSVQKEQSIKTFKDGIDFTADDLKACLTASDRSVKTSQASMPDMFAAADEMCSKYDQVFVFPIHKNLSGNVNTWKIVKEDYANLNIVMTCDIGGSFAWTIQKVKQYLTDNEANEESLQKFVDEQIIPNRIGFLMVNDLNQLIKGGRLTGLKAAIAKLLKIRPIILFSKDGLSNLDKTKSNDGFFKIVDKYLSENYKNKKVTRVILFVPHNDDQFSNEYKSDFMVHYGNIPFETKCFPTVVVSHTGLKHAAIYFEFE